MKSLPRFSTLAALVACAFFTRPLSAQFAAIVHDPLNDIQLIYANGSLVQQIEETISLFNLATQEATALRNKQYMQAFGYISNFALYSMAGHSHWTVGLTTPIGIAAASTVWLDMASPAIAAIPSLTIQNRIRLADGFGSSMIDALGGCNASIGATDAAIGALEQIVLSVAVLDNTNDALGGARSAAAMQQLRMQECQHNMQQQQAHMLMLQTLRQRDYENAQFTTYQNIDVIANGNPAGIVNIGGLNTADLN
jgi:hypothetical protein